MTPRPLRKSSPTYTHTTITCLTKPSIPPLSVTSQGLVFVDGVLYESTGLRGRSSLRQVDADTGKVVRSTALSNDLFGESTRSTCARLVQQVVHDAE